MRNHDPEPERYYDWMLWKMRQENKKELEQKDEIGLDKLQELVTMKEQGYSVNGLARQSPKL